MIRNRIIHFCRQSHIGMIGLLFLLLGLAGCQDFTDDTGKTMPEPDLKFADGTLKLPLDEKEYEVDVESNLPWRVKTSAAWIDLLTSNGMGTGSFKMSVTRNTNVASREAEIAAWIIEGAETKLKVVQEGIGIALKKRTLKVGAEGSLEEVIPFSTMVTYTYELSDDCDWIHITDGSPITPGIVNESELKLKIDPYMDVEDGRTAYLYLKGSNGVTDMLTVTQDKKPLGDIDYLRMFYESANGENWVKKWNFDAPLETNATNWPGLKFENKRVVEIDIQSPNGIEGDIIPLCELSELRSLKLKHQKITGIPEEIGQLSQLTTLWIIESAAGGNLPESLGECQLLTSFNISNHPTATPAGFNNTFSGNLDVLIKIPGIVTIKAYCNNLSGPLPVIPLDGNNLPATWKNLKEFIIYTNGFSGSIPYGYGVAIERSGSSGIFRVSDNQLSGQIPSDIKAWSQYATRKAGWILQGNNLTE
ncbi:BACON domain-containing protein [Bacteroides congonensis]